MIPLGAGVGRVVEDVRRFIDPELVGTAEEGRLVTVGSERDLVNRFDVTLGVVVDADGMLGAPHYRAAEDTLRLIARLAQSTDRANSGRVVLQTSDPDHPVIHTLVSGHPQKFLANELDVRKKAGFPPEGQLIAIEVRDSDDADADLRSAVAAPATIRGPAKMRDRQRWLIQGEDLSDTRLALRPVLGRLRNAGAKVRVDADPIDL